MAEEKTLRVKFATWKRLMELSLSLADNQRLSIDAVIGRLLRNWDDQEGLIVCGTYGAIKVAEEEIASVRDGERDSEGITTRIRV